MPLRKNVTNHIYTGNSFLLFKIKSCKKPKLSNTWEKQNGNKKIKNTNYAYTCTWEKQNGNKQN